MSKHSLSLSELIDLEVAAETDRSLSLEHLRERDQKLGRELQGRFGRPLAEMPASHLLRSWVRVALPSPSPGTRFVGFLAVADLVLMVLGLVIGASGSAALLHYDGSTPINAIQYLGVFVVLQGLLLILLVLHMAFGGRLGVVQEALRSFAYVRSRLFERIEGGLTTLRRLHKVYNGPEAWLIMKVTQRFALAFHLGALGVTFYLVGFTDLAFSWSTTLDLSAETFHRVLYAAATPWHFLGDGWLLSIEQVRDTQYFRLEGRYMPSAGASMATDSQVVGSWWRYLVAAHFAYGLLPRLMLWIFSHVMFKRSLRSVRLDGLAFGAIRRRLLDAIRSPVAVEPTDGGVSFSSPSPSALRLSAGPCRVIGWRDFPSSAAIVGAYLQQHFAMQPAAMHLVGGTADDHDGQKALAKSGADSMPWVVLVEDWESPGKAFKNLILRLRMQTPEREVFVIPIKLVDGQMAGTSSERFELWRRHVDGLADPHVGVIA